MTLARRIALAVLVAAALLISLQQYRRRHVRPTAGPRSFGVVSLAPSLTEIIYAVGSSNTLVGRTSACDHPPAAVRNVPVVGDFGAPSVEMLCALQPTLVFYVDLADRSMAVKLKEMGIHAVQVPCARLNDIPLAVESVGKALNRAGAGKQLAADLSAQLRQFQSQARAIKSPRKVFVEIWHDPLLTVGRNSFVSELIELAGGVNIGDEVDRDYFQTSSEWVLARNPDVILCLYMSPGSAARRAAMNRPGWSSISAVRAGRVYDGLDNNLILRPGPRVIDGIKELRRHIQAR